MVGVLFQRRPREGNSETREPRICGAAIDKKRGDSLGSTDCAIGDHFYLECARTCVKGTKKAQEA